MKILVKVMIEFYLRDFEYILKYPYLQTNLY